MSAIAATLLLLSLAFAVSGVQKFTVTPDRGVVLHIRSSQPRGCRVCTAAGRSRHCDASLLLKDVPASVEFECSRPQDIFNVEIVQDIKCTAKSCSGHITQADSGSQPLVDFNRKFIWNLRADAPKAFRVDFAGAGLRQVKASERCPDGHSYTLRASQTTGDVAIGKYCTTGPVCSAQILNNGSLSLDVPAGQKLQNGHFHVSVGEEIKSLAKISLTLPRGTSSVELLSANYPDSFPDDDVMEWYFQVPDKHRTTVQLSDLTQPRCLKKDTAVEYHSTGTGALALRLTDPQPEQTQGSFSLTLRNCEMDRRRAGSPGLSLRLKVSSSAQTSSVSCRVDVSEMEGLSLRIEKSRPASGCQMEINSVQKEVITVTSNSDLFFHGCLPEHLQITAMRVVECPQLRDCSKTPVRLSVPPLPTCLPAPLSTVTWTLRPPWHGTVELTSPMGHLRQSLPGQPCNGSILIRVAEDDGATVGHFCPLGAIQKVQVHSNVSVTFSNMGGKTPRMAVLNAVMKEEIPERYIFNVSPKRDTPVLLATPGWPVGMRAYSTVSWIVSVPPRMEARLTFANLSQPKCSTRHTNIRVQRVGRLEKDYSRREDEEAESEIVVSESFYLNMSNCMAERGDFSVVARITLQKSINRLLTIVLSVVAALLVIFVIVLVVVCVVIKKKKKKLTHQVSIYNPNGTSFLPGLNGVPETHGGSDDHEYASIDDTLVYTHLLRKGREASVYGEFDTYRPFTGLTDAQKPLHPKDNRADGSEQPVRLSSELAPPIPLRPLSNHQSLVDNVIYQAADQSDADDEERSLSLGPRLEPEGGN